MYPVNKKSPNGKIRLIYEAYPLAYIIKSAGGDSYGYDTDILNIPFNKNDIHQKIPIFFGSKYEIKYLQSLL